MENRSHMQKTHPFMDVSADVVIDNSNSNNENIHYK